jgi:hypothetical protein
VAGFFSNLFGAGIVCLLERGAGVVGTVDCWLPDMLSKLACTTDGRAKLAEIMTARCGIGMEGVV